MADTMVFKKPLINTLLFYLTGCTASYLAYLLIPHTYIHAPGVHHFLILLMFGASFIWGIACLLFSFSEKGLPTDRWTGIFHLIPSVGFAIWFVFAVIFPEHQVHENFSI